MSTMEFSAPTSHETPWCSRWAHEGIKQGYKELAWGESQTGT